METKALKRQMGAAIAMVLVAAIALAASTYAWLVSNNQVKATTASVSAQSNAPFLKIAKAGEELTDTMATQIANTDAGDFTSLYPSQWAAVTSSTYQFESAYGRSATEATILNGSRFAVGGVDAKARPKYALKQSFDIGTTEEKAGSFENLKVSSVSVNTGNNIEGESSEGLKDALCVLVTCGDQWAVYKANGGTALLEEYGDGTTIANKVLAEDALAATIGAGKDNKVTVDVYVFYDGSASTVYTNNEANLKNCSVEVTFSATPVNTEGDAVSSDNNFVKTVNGKFVQEPANDAEVKQDDAEPKD